jgi:hypothetical protein
MVHASYLDISLLSIVDSFVQKTFYSKVQSYWSLGMLFGLYHNIAHLYVIIDALWFWGDIYMLWYNRTFITWYILVSMDWIA